MIEKRIDEINYFWNDNIRKFHKSIILHFICGGKRCNKKVLGNKTSQVILDERNHMTPKLAILIICNIKNYIITYFTEIITVTYTETHEEF